MTRTTFTHTNRAAAKWYVVDASQEVLGRLATQLARMLMGKHKPTYTPFSDTGDFIVVLNAKDVKVTGRKATDKTYHFHTRFPGGLKEWIYPKMRERHPEEMVRMAVRRMLPKTTMGRHMLRKLKIYPGKEHPHHAQMPEPISFGTGSLGTGGA
jgi:large subunit ribosomal protein L13